MYLNLMVGANHTEVQMVSIEKANGGRPLKGGSREKTPLPAKNTFFRLSLDGFERAFSNPSTSTFTTTPSCLMACSASVISYFLVSGGIKGVPIRTSHPSGLRRWCSLTIRCQKQRSFRLWRARRSSVPCRVQLDVSQTCGY